MINILKMIVFLVVIFLSSYQIHAQCSGTTTLSSQTGTFNDGSGSGNYTSNLNCTWLIQPNSSNYVLLNFTAFDTEKNFDFVTIYESNSSGNVISGPFSGVLSNIPTIYSQSSSIFLKFTSDGSVEAAGWNAFYQGLSGIPPTCSGRLQLNSMNGTVSDKIGSGSYTDNVNCEWLIQPTGAVAVRIQLLSFQTEMNYDFLTFYDGTTRNSATLAGPFSGTIGALPDFTSTTGSVLVVFTSDGSNTGAGWTLVYNATSTPGSPSPTINSSQSTTPSPGISASNSPSYNPFPSSSPWYSTSTPSPWYSTNTPSPWYSTSTPSPTSYQMTAFPTPSEPFASNSPWFGGTTGSSSSSSGSGNDKNSGGTTTKAAIGAGVGGGILVCASIALAAFFISRNKKKSQSGNDVEMNNEDGKEGGTVSTFFTQLERKEFLPVGIPDIDDLFSKVQAPLDTLCDMSDSITAATEAIASLDEQRQEVAQVAQAPFGDKLKFVLAEAGKAGCQLVPSINGTKISLKVVGQGSGLVLQGVENINTLISSAMDVILKTPEIIQQLIELGQTASEFPDKIKDMASAAGLSFMKVPKAIKNLSQNIKYLAAAPNDVKGFLESIQQLVQTIKEVFGIGEESGNTAQQLTIQDSQATQSPNNNNVNNNQTATVVALQMVQPTAEPKKKIKIFVKRINKRGGAEMLLPDTLEELLDKGGVIIISVFSDMSGQLLGIRALKVRNAETEFLIADISLIEPNQTIYLTDANDEAQFE